MRGAMDLPAQPLSPMRAERSLALQLDAAVQAMPVWPRPEEAPDLDLSALVRVAEGLRELPREEFRVALKSDLQRRVSMNEGTAAGTGEAKARAVHYQRPGLTSITPYIIVRPAAQFIEFLKSAFAGIERLRMPTPGGLIMHAEVEIGNGAIEVSDGNEEYPTSPAAVHLYVDDADATYQRAMRAGATSITPVADQPWGDRWGAGTLRWKSPRRTGRCNRCLATCMCIYQIRMRPMRGRSRRGQRRFRCLRISLMGTGGGGGGM